MIGKTIINFYFYTGCHTSLCSCFLLHYICNKHGYDYTKMSFLTLFCMVWFGYSWVQLPFLSTGARQKNKQISSNKRQSFFLQKKKIIYSLVSICIAISFCLVFKLSDFMFLFVMHLVILLLFYQLPSRYLSLRRIPYLKTFLISYIWSSLITVFAILPQTREEFIGKLSYVTFLDLFFFIASLTLLFDYRDRMDDRAEKIKTFANLQINNPKFIKVLSLIFFGLSIFFSGFYLHREVRFIFYLVTYCLVLYFTNKKRGDLYYLAIIDSLMIIKPLLAIKLT